MCQDFAAAGDHVFVADDLFWYHPQRSLALARELLRRGIKKQWILVQSRVDLVARHADLLEAWRPLAKDFDIFFGLEAATNEGLSGLKKDATVDQTGQGVEVARSLAYGVTGNFVIDPEWREVDFENLWAFVERFQLFQAGFTILTPLPGTSYFEDMRSRVQSRPWSHFDMHHLLWEPALGPERFFELYCETWRRSVLNLKGRKSLWRWLREVDPRNMLFLLRALKRTQRMMAPEHYLSEYDIPRAPGATALGATRGPERRRCRELTSRTDQRGGLAASAILNQDGSMAAFGLTSVNVISLVSPLGKVIRIAVRSSVVRSSQSSSRVIPSRICFRLGTIAIR